MVQAKQNEKQTRKIKRTVCIGLGGTGRDVLMRIRRLIVDRYGDLSELPVISFVHIDTDKGAVSSLRTGSIYHGVDLSFRDAETVMTTMTRVEVNTFVQGVERRSQDERQGPYDHISRWFPPQLLKDIKTIEEGAKGIRAVGRLAFFHNYRKIKNALDTAEKRTRGHEGILLKKGFNIDPGLNIFVAGSLCGGTGSGMFLDIAYTLRRNYGDQGAQIWGYLIISPELYGNTPIMNANTYAALKELNHYATSGSRFVACYDPQNLDIVQEQRPPFEYVYLVSNQTATDYRILEKSKLANVIAYKIFIDCVGELAPVLKEPRDNFLLHMIQNDEHPRPNVQRYLTFGLSQLYFPRDISVQIALNRLRRKLVNFWLNGEGQTPDPQVLIERFLLNWSSDTSRRDIFSIKLEDATKESNKTFSQTINSWRNKLEANITEAKTKQDRQAIIEQLPREFREQFRKVQPGETESDRGIWLTTLQENSKRLTEKFKQDITQFVQELLNPESPEFSLTTCRNFIEALITELNKLQRNIEDKIQSAGGLNRIEDVDRRWKETEQSIIDLEQKGGLPLFNNRKHGQILDEANNIVKQVQDLVKNNFQLVLNQEALKIVKNLQQHVQNLASKANNFYNVLTNLLGTYEKQEEDLKLLNVDEMTGEAIFSESDSEEYYQTLLPASQRRSQLATVSTKITEELVMNQSLLGFLAKDLLDEIQLQQQINITVDRLFGARGSQMAQSVIKRFIENYSYQERSTRLEQIIREAEPLLPLNFADPYFYNDAGKTIKLIAFKDTDEPEVKQFKSLLIRELGTPDNQLKPIQAEDEIIIISEYAGFPLRLINGLEQMRQQYVRQQNYGAFVHNDYATIFTEVIPPDARKMEDLQDIFYPCLAFKLLAYNNANQCFEFEFYDELRGTRQKASLSPVWDQALELLSLRGDMTHTLRGILEGAIAEMDRQPQLWEKKYLPSLREFVQRVDELPEDHPNYLYKEKVVGIRATIDTPAKEGIIDRFRQKMERRIIRNNSTSLLAETPVNQQMLTSSTNMTQEEIAEIIEPEIAAPATNQTKDSMAQLKELVEMKQNGFLTEAEFQAAKKKILGI